MKTDPQSVKTFVKKRVGDQFPGAVLKDVSDETLALTHANGEQQVINIERIQGVCKQEPRRCGGAVDSLLIVLTEANEKRSEPFPVDRLRPVLTTKERLGKFWVANAASPDSPDTSSSLPLAYELAGELLVTFYALREYSAVLVNTTTLKQIGLTPRQLDRKALENLKNLTTEPTLVPFPGHPGVFMVRSHFLATSEILVAERLASFAKVIGAQDLAIGVPSSNVAFLANASDSKAMEQLAAAVEKHYKDYRGGLSPEILLFTRGNWGLYRSPRPGSRATLG